MNAVVGIITALAAACLVACSTAQRPTPPPALATLRVMTFNLWHGGDQGNQPLEQSAAVIRAANADVVGLQETAGLAPKGQPRPDNSLKLAKLLNYHHLDQGNNTAILSRHPIVATTPLKKGATVQLPTAQRIHVFNVHLMHAPYQPYQLLNIPYQDGPFIKTEQEAIVQAKKARGAQVADLLREIESVTAEGLPVFITGDFNEPSHLDWTQAAADAGKCPIKVEWPTTKALADAGFTDALRNVRPDPLNDQANTWTPITDSTDPKDRHDRIDFVLSRGPGVKVVQANLVGENPRFAQIVVHPYPSDHRSVVATFELSSRPDPAPPD
jgi:endonuclease/exonuclease/phosphatase family metal-dependent hydrolase